MSKPDVVFVTGKPGSGKSTLARILAEKLYSYTHIDEDDILQSFWEQSKGDSKYDRHTVGRPRLKKVLEYMLDQNVRLVVEMHPDTKWLQNLTKGYDILGIHCKAKDSRTRFYQRELLEDGSEPDWLTEIMKEIESIESGCKDPPEGISRVIEVNTDSGYKPSINQLLQEIEQ